MANTNQIEQVTWRDATHEEIRTDRTPVVEGV